MKSQVFHRDMRELQMLREHAELEAEIKRLRDALEQIYGITAYLTVSERIVRIHTIAGNALEASQ